jgi:fatty acid desaturase
MFNDRRDTHFLRLILLASIWAFTGAIVIYAWPSPPLWLAALYLVGLLGWLMPPFVLMLHFTSHRPMFTKRWRVLNSYVPLLLAPFFGQSPGTYAAHHVGMHHPEQNSWADASSTMGYQRDSALDFARYLGRFLAVGIFDLCHYLARSRRGRLLRRAMLGEALYLGGIVALLFWKPFPTLVVFVIPLLAVRFAMMAGNWGQHAFIDPAQPLSPMHNSATCTAHGYNERCYNDGFHATHHLRPTLHWSELPLEFERQRHRYAEAGAVVFQGIDFVGLWALLLTRRYRRLASHFVQLGPVPMTEDEVIGLLKTRVARFTPGPLDHEGGQHPDAPSGAARAA